MRYFVVSVVLAVFGIFGIILGVFECGRKRSDPPNIEFWVGRDFKEFQSVFGVTENVGSGFGIFDYEFSGRTFRVWGGNGKVVSIVDVTEEVSGKEVGRSKSLNVGG